MRYFSTFSGIGGFELGIQLAYVDVSTPSRSKQRRMDMEKSSSINDGQSVGTQQSLTCVGYSEIDKYADQIYQKQFPTHKNYGDITKIDAKQLPDFEILVGGFPCQSFSIAGKRAGFDDTRGTMFFELARIIREKQPRICVFENVKGLLSHDKGDTFTTVISTLDELGYDCQWQVLNSKNHGVPQNRERVFIIGHLRGTNRPQVFPFGESHSINNGKAPQGNDLAYCLQAGNDKHRGSYVNQDKNKIRRLTPTECERLQGFPDGWTEGISDTQRYKCLGNAVTVNVVASVFNKITN